MTTQFHTALNGRSVPAFLMLVVMLVAITCRAAIPAGYMPDLQDDGIFEMVICTGNGSETIHVDKNMQPINPADNPDERDASSHMTDSHDGYCAFALNTHYLSLADLPDTGNLSALYGVLHLPSLITAKAYRVFYGNNSSRAPPLFYV